MSRAIRWLSVFVAAAAGAICLCFVPQHTPHNMGRDHTPLSAYDCTPYAADKLKKGDPGALKAVQNEQKLHPSYTRTLAYRDLSDGDRISVYAEFLRDYCGYEIALVTGHHAAPSKDTANMPARYDDAETWVYHGKSYAPRTDTVCISNTESRRNATWTRSGVDQYFNLAVTCDRLYPEDSWGKVPNPLKTIDPFHSMI